MGRGRDKVKRKHPQLKSEYVRRVRFTCNPETKFVSIPWAIADKLGIKQGDSVRIRMLGNCVVINKLEENANETYRRTEETG